MDVVCVSVGGGVGAGVPPCNIIQAPMLPAMTTTPASARIRDRFDFFGAAAATGASATEDDAMFPVIAGAALGVSIVGSPAPVITPGCVLGDIMVGSEPVVIGCCPVRPGNGVGCAIEVRE